MQIEPQNDDENPKEVHFIQEQPTNSETSLRHFFYLEYKTKFPDG
jgi:hypothetical protein